VLDTPRFILQTYRLTRLPRRRREEILSLQQARLRRLLRYVQEQSFYRQRPGAVSATRATPRY
jgi:hypothetical protein